MSEVSVTDRSPTLAQIARVDDLRKCLAPFLKWGLAGTSIFDAKGEVFLSLGDDDCPMNTWERLPPEAEAASRGLGDRTFGSGEHVFEARPAFAGADRVGVSVFACKAENADRLTEFADALAGVMGALLQSGFATWVTSELHLAASESNYVALEGQNQELRRAVEHLRGLDKLKSNFLATVSHELRTPLTSVIGFAEMLLQGIAGDLNEEQREYTQTIFDRGEELLTLIIQILEMSRMEMGMVHLGVASVRVVDMAERAIDAVGLAAQRASVHVRHDISADLPAVTADADKVHQVLVNLANNAIKFTREGGEVVISAEIAPIRRPFEEEDFFGDEEENAVAVTVRDTGIGIPEEQLNQIFEAFYQVDASSTREHGGAGLGLSIVKKLIEAHGGEVWAESSVGVGTSFTFTLPQVRVGADEEPTPSRPAETDEQTPVADEEDLPGDA